jgi:hypothetical protein
MRAHEGGAAPRSRGSRSEPIGRIRCLLSDKALILAEKAATNGGSKALELAKQAAKSKSVKRASNKQADAIVKVVAGSVTTGGTAALMRRPPNARTAA